MSMRREVKYVDLGGTTRTGTVWSDAPGVGCVWVIPHPPLPRTWVKVRITEGKRSMIRQVEE